MVRDLSGMNRSGGSRSIDSKGENVEIRAEGDQRPRSTLSLRGTLAEHFNLTASVAITMREQGCCLSTVAKTNKPRSSESNPERQSRGNLEAIIAN